MLLPGKNYSVRDLVAILLKRVWIPLVLLPLGLAIGWGIERRLPDKYMSETVILVVPQRVPEAYVRSTITTRIEDRLRTISQQILSRTRLEKIINEFKLYQNELRKRPLDDVIAAMRNNDIRLEIVRSDSFRVTYSYGNPRTAMQVTERLATLFIEDNLREREAQAEGTSQFLETQLEDARRRLVEQEKRLEEYRKRHSGELPSQLQANLQVIQGTRLQLQALTDSLNRDRDRSVVVESMLTDLATMPDPATVGQTDPARTAQLPLQQQLDLARQEVEALQRRFTKEHPDVIKAKRRVQELTARLANVPTTGEGSVAPGLSAASAARQTELSRLRAERESLDRQIANKIQEEEKLRKTISVYQARVEVVPTRESELIELTRDSETLQAAYRSLLSKMEESRLATNLERRQIGEQFRVLDPARMPERPYTPNRRLIRFIGAAAALVLGLGVIVLLEVLNKTFKVEAEVSHVLSLPVLAVVPHVIDAAAATRRRHHLRRLFLSAALVTIVGVGVYLSGLDPW